MSDSWSLNGKVKSLNKVDVNGDMFTWGMFFSVDDITLLRQKLIEDIKYEALKAGNEICWEDCKWIINKRFGVDE